MVPPQQGSFATDTCCSGRVTASRPAQAPGRHCQYHSFCKGTEKEQWLAADKHDVGNTSTQEICQKSQAAGRHGDSARQCEEADCGRR